MEPIDLGIPGLANIERIGAGGNAVVYRAHQVELDRTVVVKVLTTVDAEATRRRFDRERRAMGRLSQAPGIAPIYDSGFTPSGQPWLLMPYYEHGSLQDVIDRGGPLPPEQVRNIGVRIARAVHAAHVAGVLHRDLKPANILMPTTGQPDVADFGIAHLPDDTLGVSQALTMTPLYTAPEVFDGVESGVAGDVYSLGALLFALANGRPAFANPDGSPATVLALMRRINESPVPGLSPAVPPQLAAAIRQAMSKDPGERQPSAVALAEQLERVDLTQASAPPIAPPAPASAPSPTRRGLVVAAVVALLAVIGVVAFMFVRSGASDTNQADDGPDNSLVNQTPTAIVAGTPTPRATTQPTPTVAPFDEAAVSAAAAQSIVLVEGFSCTGVERAPGVMLDDGRVLTSSSVLLSPWFIGVTQSTGSLAQAAAVTRDLNRDLGLVQPIDDVGVPSAIASADLGDRVAFVSLDRAPVFAELVRDGSRLTADLPLAEAVAIEHATAVFGRDGALVGVAGELDDGIEVLPVLDLDNGWNRTPPQTGCPSTVRELDASDVDEISHPHVAELLYLQRLSTALADGRWNDVRRWEPAKASLSDASFENGWGPLDQGFVYPVQRTQLSEGRASWRLGLIGHERWRGEQLTTLFCVTWEVDRATGTVVQTNDDTVEVYGSQPGATQRSGTIDPGELIVLIVNNCPS